MPLSFTCSSSPVVIVALLNHYARQQHEPSALMIPISVCLRLRSGKIEQAAALLDQVMKSFPVEPAETNRPASADLIDTLYVSGSAYFSFDIHPSMQILAELGVLRLARREYTEALDALLRA